MFKTSFADSQLSFSTGNQKRYLLMRVLFAFLNNYRKGDIIIDFTRCPAEFLSQRHEVGALSKTTLIKGNKNTYRSLTNFDFGLWDIIVLQDLVSASRLQRHINKLKTPAIFIGHGDAWSYQPVLFKNILNVYSASRDFQLPFSNIPVQYFNRPLLKTNTLGNKAEQIKPPEEGNLRIIYYHDDNDRNLSVLKAVINFGNHNAGATLCIVIKKSLEVLVKSFINPNIELIKDPGLLRNHYHLAIANDRKAIETLAMGIPTMIMGVRGFGGMITTENVRQHLALHMNGRLGGEIGEPIPYEVVSDEFQVFKQRFLFYYHNTKKVSEILRDLLD